MAGVREAFPSSSGSSSTTAGPAISARSASWAFKGVSKLASAAARPENGRSRSSSVHLARPQRSSLCCRNSVTSRLLPMPASPWTVTSKTPCSLVRQASSRKVSSG